MTGQIKIADVREFLNETEEILNTDKRSLRVALTARSGGDGRISHDDLYAIDPMLARLYHRR